MDWLPHSVEGGITFFFSVLALIVGGIVRVTQAYRTAATKRMTSVPPSQPTAELVKRLDTLERDVAMARAKWREDELIARIGNLERLLLEKTEDIEQLQRTVVSERQLRQRAERELALLRAQRG